MNMKVLPSNKHDKRKIEVTCSYCGVKFRRSPEKITIRPRCGKNCPGRLETRRCRLCGDPFLAYVDSKQKVCVRTCEGFSRNISGVSMTSERLSKKRKAIYLQGDEINRLDIYERDGWICGLCGQPVDNRLRNPDPWAATIDHVIPLCRGGEHTYDNCQLAHAYCNSVKGAA